MALQRRVSSPEPPSASLRSRTSCLASIEPSRFTRAEAAPQERPFLIVNERQILRFIWKKMSKVTPGRSFIFYFVYFAQSLYYICLCVYIYIHMFHFIYIHIYTSFCILLVYIYIFHPCFLIFIFYSRVFSLLVLLL